MASDQTSIQKLEQKFDELFLIQKIFSNQNKKEQEKNDSQKTTDIQLKFDTWNLNYKENKFKNYYL